MWVKEAEPDGGIEIVEMFFAVESEAKVKKSAIAPYRRRCLLLYILGREGGREQRQRETKVGKRGSFGKGTADLNKRVAVSALSSLLHPLYLHNPREEERTRTPPSSREGGNDGEGRETHLESTV